MERKEDRKRKDIDPLIFKVILALSISGGAILGIVAYNLHWFSF